MNHEDFKGFTLRRVMGQAIVVATGEASQQFRGMIKLNQTAADIWDWLDKGLSESEMADQLAKKYEIPVEKAAADVEKLIDQMRTSGILEA